MKIAKNSYSASTFAGWLRELPKLVLLLLEPKTPRFFLPPRLLIESLAEEAAVAVVSEELCWELSSSDGADSSSTLLSERRLLPEEADSSEAVLPDESFLPH